MEESECMLRVTDLTKVYTLADGSEVRALDNFSFELAKGEILGIVGRNGSGKTTLLKVLNRITPPTSGSAEYRGVLTSVIEIGTGFHMDLTGRENVYMSANILGLTKSQIKAHFQEILDFSGLGSFIDMPAKTYSSGMYLRLAFSVAFFAEVDILLLDEVLAVGDHDFRRKCYDRIRDMRRRGASIVIVSHQMEPLLEFCDRCLWMENGKYMADGVPMEIIDRYLSFSSQKDVVVRQQLNEAPGLDQAVFSADTPFASIERIEVKGPGEEIYMQDEVRIAVYCTKKTDEDSLEIGLTLTNLNGVRILLDSYGLRENYVPPVTRAGSYCIECVIPANWLNRGIYAVHLTINRNREYLENFEDVIRFRALEKKSVMFGKEINTVLRPELEWKIERLEKR